MKTSATLPRKKYRIVYAEDKILVREAITNYINRFKDFEIIKQCSNGKEVMAFLGNEPLPDILLTDLQMPVMNGYETIVQVKARFPQIKIIVLTIFDTDAVRSIAKSLGADKVISKAIEEKDLAKALYDLYVTKSIKPMPQEEFLSKREMKFLRLLCSDAKFIDIPAKLLISLSLAEKIRKQLFKKFSVDNSPSLVKYVTENGIII